MTPELLAGRYRILSPLAWAPAAWARCFSPTTPVAGRRNLQGPWLALESFATGLTIIGGRAARFLREGH